MGDTKVKSGTMAYGLNTFLAESELDSSLKWVEMPIKFRKFGGVQAVQMTGEVRETTKNAP